MTPHRNDVVHSEMARKNVPVLRTKAKFPSINDARARAHFFRYLAVDFVKCIRILNSFVEFFFNVFFSGVPQ